MRNILAFIPITMILLSSIPAFGEDITLRVHHFMSQSSSLHDKMLVPFAKKIEQASNGRIKVELFASMSLGGRPSDLYDQAVDGAVDIILTLPGYTAGRFNRSEVFELPFMMQDSVATSKAFWDLIDQDLQHEEFEEVRILSAWVHGPGVLHSKEPITQLEDLAGKEIRGPTRVVTDLLGELGAIPVGMPLPKIPENLSKGVISATALPWEITPSIRLTELVTNHTELSGDKALYTAVFILAMNLDTYEAMPSDLKAILDKQTGKVMAEFAGQVMASSDAIGRNQAVERNIVILDQDEVTRWVDAAQPVYERWIERAQEKGFDGKAAIKQAQKLIRANQ